jgi:hypothetical protein
MSIVLKQQANNISCAKKTTAKIKSGRPVVAIWVMGIYLFGLIIRLSQNISKCWSTKVNVFG